jgi:hypothetical protein
MKTGLLGGLVLLALAGVNSAAQEATAGVDLRAVLTAQLAGSTQLSEEPRSGSPVAPGSRAVVYPTIKFDDNWFITGAVQFVTRPYYYSDFSPQGYGARGNLLQATLNYSRIADRGSLLVRVGSLSTAFGSFLLRYDDSQNALIDLPPQYGYYYAPVSFLPVAGVEVDATRGKWDGRLQFANSSPANPHNVFSAGQYGNWAGGAGYTVRQGLRVGASGYYGPYLDQQYAYYFPGEVSPSKLPAHAIGIDGNWAHGHTSAFVEVQRFVMPYTVIPDFRETAGYAEVSQVLSPRWFVAGRYSITSNSATGNLNVIETTVGFRPNRFQLLKCGYELRHYSTSAQPNDNAVTVQFITTFHKSIGR